MIRKGSKVLFGRPNGEQTKGEVVKVNRTTFKIRTLEERGNGRGSGVGNIWKVHKSLVTLDGASGTPDTPDASRSRLGAATTTEEALVARALRKLTGAERYALAVHFRRGYVSGDRF